jgi:nucleoside-diphosphate-sugar epimerase
MKVIITGSTGMVGKAVLIECLESHHVESVLVVNRNPIDVKHPKLKEITHRDFTNLDPITDQLKGYDTCFYCMGVSAFGMSESNYYRITYTMTEVFAKTLYKLNPETVFNYVSGTGTDSSEKGRVMWARVKGKTENMVLGMGFKDAYAFRPGAILPEKGVKSKTGWYNAFYVITRPFFPLFRKMKSVAPSSNVGKAMINSVMYPGEKKWLENQDINELAKKSQN